MEIDAGETPIDSAERIGRECESHKSYYDLSEYGFGMKRQSQWMLLLI